MGVNMETGTPNYMKYINKKIILNYIRKHGSTSRAEIADKLTLSKPTVSNLVEELLTENWIREVGSGDSTIQGGRKPIQLEFNPQAGYIIGVDIGGTKIAYGIGDIDGQIIAKDVMPTQPYVENDLIQELVTRINLLLEKANINEEQVLGIGVGNPGITDVEKGIVISAPSLQWTNYPLKEQLQNHFPFPVYVDNDVNVSVLGEQWLGSAKDKKNVVLITIGTGVGSGMIINGNLYRGSNWAAGEIGYTVTDKNAAKAGYNPIFDGFGFLENHAGGPSIARRMRELLSEHPEHQLLEKVDAANITAKDVFDYAKQQDPLAIQVINDAMDHLGFAIVNVAALFNPEIIILGGGVSRAGECLVKRLNKILKTYLPTEVELSLTKLGDSIGIIGGMSLFLREHESLLKM